MCIRDSVNDHKDGHVFLVISIGDVVLDLVEEIHFPEAVSYTHLDVYKRQRLWFAIYWFLYQRFGIRG